MKRLFEKLFKKSSNKKIDNIYSICSSADNDLRSYCSLEYTYIRKDSI